LAANGSRRKPKVAIIGAGMGGLCAAVSLDKLGFETHVYERAPELGEYGAGLQLGPNCYRVFRALGLEAQLRKVAFEPLSNVSINWNDGRLRYSEPMKGPYEARFGAPYMTAHRGDLHRLFRDHLSDTGFSVSKRCVGATSHGDVAVATFADGDEIEADVLIGADGIRSAIRQQLFGADAPRFTEQMAWRAIVPVDCVPPAFGPDKSTRLERADYFGWLGPNGHVICYPIGDGSMLNIFAGHVSRDWVDESWTAPSSKEELIAAHEGWNEALLDIFSHVGDVFKWGIFDRDPRPQWRAGRIVLLGDAAHPTMPTLAQGANMAIEDGYAIARCLARHADDPVAGLDAFVAERQPRTARVTLQSRQQFANNRMTPPPPPMSRDWIFEHDVTL
jgi:salicylate hydroxylase